MRKSSKISTFIVFFRRCQKVPFSTNVSSCLGNVGTSSRQENLKIPRFRSPGWPVICKVFCHKKWSIGHIIVRIPGFPGIPCTRKNALFRYFLTRFFSFARIGTFELFYGKYWSIFAQKSVLSRFCQDLAAGSQKSTIIGKYWLKSPF